MANDDKAGLAIGQLLGRGNPFRALIPLKIVLFSALLGALFLEFSTEFTVNWTHGLQAKIGGADAVVAVSACAVTIFLVLVDFIAAIRMAKLRERIWDVILDPNTPGKLRDALLKQVGK